ncbi:hypothetical protein pb186bvf_003500 [Paramecium bursaria]
MVLTQKQRDELNQAIFQYLQISYNQTAAVFKVEANIKDGQIEADLLEKKWNSIVRLSKRVMTLEQQVEHLNEQLQQAQKGKVSLKNDVASLIPSEKYRLQGHKDVVNSISFHPQYQLIASGSDDGTIKLWDYESGSFEKTLKGHTASVNSVAFDPTGKYLSSASGDMSLKLWELKNYSCLRTLIGHEHSVSSITFSEGGDFLLSASRDKTAKLWEVSTGFCKRTFNNHDEWVRCAVFSNDQKQIATCTQDQFIFIWQTDNGQQVHQLAGHDHVVEFVKYIPEHGAKLINKTQQQNGQIYNLLISTSRDKTIKVWNTLTGAQLFTLSGHDNWVNGIAFHQDGVHIYSASDDKTIRLWNLVQQKQIKKIENAHDNFICKIALFQNILASCSTDQSIKVWQLT